MHSQMHSQMHSRKRMSVLLMFGAVLLSVCVTACSSPTLPGTGGSEQPVGNGVVGWPFDITRGSWAIENGYNWGPDQSGDHVKYELYSFDFNRTDAATTGQDVLSPVTGDSIDIGSAAPSDFSSGHCARIGIDGAAYTGYYVMVCHLDSVKQGHVSRGDLLGKVSGGPNGNHIHITLYKLINPQIPDDTDHLDNRQAIVFDDPWTIGGCPYPYRDDGSKNQWATTPVPCTQSSTSAPGSVSSAPTATQTASPRPVATATSDAKAACKAVSAFASAGAIAPLADQFIVHPVLGKPTVPFPPNSVGYVERTFDDPAVDEPNMVYHFELLDACSPSNTADGVRSFFAAQMPRATWDQSNTFPYGGDYSRGCGDPYCWLWGPTGGDISRFASLESVRQVGSAAVYQVRLGIEAPQQ